MGKRVEKIEEEEGMSAPITLPPSFSVSFYHLFDRRSCARTGNEIQEYWKVCGMGHA
jgi:hypothetical protein